MDRYFSAPPELDTATDLEPDLVSGSDEDGKLKSEADARLRVEADGPHCPQEIPLVVDLDGTLMKSDMLFETFWRIMATRPSDAIRAAASLPGGRAAFKARLAALASFDPALLPYDEAVLDLIRCARGEGRQAVLCTASDQSIADAIAAHLGLFDRAFGSNGAINLKGKAKAAFLVERFGEEGFDYAGDSAADRAVWKHARTAHTVGLSKGQRNAVRAGTGGVSHIDRPGTGFAPYLKAIRPHQWLKNALIFLPVLAAHSFLATDWLAALAAFVSFCLIASSVYLVNDMLDLEADRAHPRKRKRPFAAGTAKLAHGTLLAPLLLIAGFGVAVLPGQPALVGVLAFYYLLTTAYSLVLKRKPVIDICVLAGLYTLRVIAGGAATGIPLSQWLLGFSVFFFFSLAAVKRQAELVDGLATGREQATGRDYHTDDLPIVSAMAIASGYASVLLFALYLNSNAMQNLYKSPALLWAICPILLFWISRVVMRAHRGMMHDDPVVFAVKDRTSLACGVAILALAILAAVL